MHDLLFASWGPQPADGILAATAMAAELTKAFSSESLPWT
jgi:hypothetical protein